MDETAKLLTMLNIMATKYKLSIDWKTSNLDKKQLNFVGDASDEQINNFIEELGDFCDKVIE